MNPQSLTCPACGAAHGEFHHAFCSIRNSDTSPLTTQIGGDHYKKLPIQVVEYVHANNIGYFEGNVIKYVSRWRSKNGIADLEKAKHYIELLMELERKNANLNAQKSPDSPA